MEFDVQSVLENSLCLVNVIHKRLPNFLKPVLSVPKPAYDLIGNDLGEARLLFRVIKVALFF